MASDRAKRELAALVSQGQTERVVYRPEKDGMPVREIDAIVDRTASEPLMNGRVEGFQISVLNDEILGIPSDGRLSDRGADQIDAARLFGGERKTRGIQRFVEQDADWITVEVR